MLQQQKTNMKQHIYDDEQIYTVEIIITPDQQSVKWF